ncbi:hypothetical protein CHS0354_009711 [Potamilus streckersoni]|uniref:Uncharacterized protein n=1 Tax=Potamilus streckersoni TaxID=2493646 RepID=A0AAE0S0H2_9BIVA|nr:hypothetical protein CHS0354_009711 [Potamilus streckersoni]
MKTKRRNYGDNDIPENSFQKLTAFRTVHHIVHPCKEGCCSRRSVKNAPEKADWLDIYRYTETFYSDDLALKKKCAYEQ